MAAADKLRQKSRRERRKEDRLSKNKKKFDSWVEHQKSHRSNKSLSDSKSNDLEKPQILSIRVSEGKEEVLTDLSYESDQSLEQPTLPTERKVVKRNKGLKKKLKTKFQEYLELDTHRGVLSAEDDLKLERKLSKKLKVKDGRLRGVDDEIGMLLEGIPSILDSFAEETISRGEKDSRKSSENGSSRKKRKKSESLEQDLDDGIMGEGDHNSEQPKKLNKSKIKLGSSKNSSSSASKADKGKKTKFEEYLEMDMPKGLGSAEEDLNLERKLAKKLKVKEGKLRGADDEFNMLLEGIPTHSQFENEDILAEEAPKKSLKKISSHKKPKKMKSSDPMETSNADVALDKVPSEALALKGNGKYIAPYLRQRAGSESEEYSQIRRRVRGLLNRLSESNVESITGEISTIFRSVGRTIGSQIFSEEVVASCSGGPRGNEQYAAVFAAFVAGMACLVGIDFGAKLLASLAKCFEDEYLKEDNLSLRNLTLLLSYLYIFGVCSIDLIYDFVIILSKRLLEIDVSTILTVLQCCGMKLRSDDPAAMKAFILSVQDRVNELKASSENGKRITSSKRMEFMLETVCDIKNNKKRPKEDTVQHTRIKKWLQKLRVEDILIRGLKWSKLVDPDKKGQWWLSGDMTSRRDNVEEVASTIDRDAHEAQKMLQLAASQRMNTDARKAIFCVLMSGEDYIDTFEKLLRLDLPGKQDREIMRVLVECCLQEKVFNKYYTVLATKLCSHDKNHKFTLQYCLWDHFKELESMQLIRSMHLSKFVAEMLASFSLSISVLKAVDLSDTTQLTPKRIMHFRMLFEAIFEHSDSLVWNIFTRVAVTPEYESLRNGIEFFVKKYVASSKTSLAQKFKVAKKAFSNVEGVIM